MSPSDVCPHCGKTFKRLKSHLPHCKERPGPPRSQHGVTAGKDPASTPPSSSRPSSETARKTEESPITTLPMTKSDKAPSSSSGQTSESRTPSKTAGESSSSPSPPTPSPVRSAPQSDPRARPTSAKKKTQRPADQTLPSSSSPSSPSPSKPVKNTSSAAPEVTPASKHVTGGPPAAAQSNPRRLSSDQLPGALCPAAEPEAARRQGAGTKPPAHLAPGSRPEGSSKTKERSSPSLLMSQTSGAAETPALCLEDGGRPAVNGAPARTTLQGVKDALRGAKGVGQPGKLGLPAHIRTSVPPGDRGPLGGSRDPPGVQAPLRNADGTGALLASTSPSTQFPHAGPPARERSPAETLPAFPPQGFKQAGAMCWPPSTLPLRAPALPSSAATGGSIALLPASSSGTSSSLQCPHPSCPLKLSVAKETGGVSDRIMTKDPEVSIRNLKLKNAIAGDLAGRSLGQVRLGELAVWLAIHAPSRPREAAEAAQRGWLRFYRKYVDVRRGGVGGVSMLLAGYCVLGYVWSYPRLKCDRWRKYH